MQHQPHTDQEDWRYSDSDRISWHTAPSQISLKTSQELLNAASTGIYSQKTPRKTICGAIHRFYKVLF